MSAKRNVLKSQLPLIVIAATVCLLTLMWLIYRSLGRSRCDSIFEQTADRVQANLEFIKIKGKLALGSQKVQELTDSSQKVGLHLKTCCNAQEAKMLNAEQFQICMSGAKDYETQIIQVATNIKEATAAEEQQKPELAKQKTDAAKQGVSEVVNTEKTLAKTTEDLPVQVRVKDVEQEPNNTIPQANVGEIGNTIAGEINPTKDVDFFAFQYRDAKKRRDNIVVRLKNRSTTLRPSLILHHEDRSIARNWDAANAPGAHFEFSFMAESEKTYFVGVASHYDATSGAYALSLQPQKAYDQYEPNDDAFAATPLKVGQMIEANIMNGSDVDSYRVSGVKEKNLTIEVKNLSPALRPSVRVLKSDKSLAQNWNAANAPGADLTFSFESQPGQDYFVEVASHYNETTGPYKLTVR